MPRASFAKLFALSVSFLTRSNICARPYSAEKLSMIVRTSRMPTEFGPPVSFQAETLNADAVQHDVVSDRLAAIDCWRLSIMVGVRGPGSKSLSLGFGNK